MLATLNMHLSVLIVLVKDMLGHLNWRNVRRIPPRNCLSMSLIRCFLATEQTRCRVLTSSAQLCPQLKGLVLCCLQPLLHFTADNQMNGSSVLHLYKLAGASVLHCVTVLHGIIAVSC